MERTKELISDRTKRIEEIKKLAGAADAYKSGLKLYQEQKWEKALEKFQEVQTLVPEYEEVNRYHDLTVKTLSGALFEEAKLEMEMGELEEAVKKLKKSAALVPEDAQIQTALKVAERDLAAKNAQASKQLYREGVEAYLGGKTKKAAEIWTKALELDPKNEDALKALSKLEEQKNYEKE